MNKPKFTKGPWKLDSDWVWNGTITVCRIHAGPNAPYKHDEIEANAALITTAPDLYNQLCVVLKRLENKQIEQLLDPSELSYLQELLNKANGHE